MKHLKRWLLVMMIILIGIITFWFIVKKYYLLDKVHAVLEQRIGEQIENEFQFSLANFRIDWLTSKAHLIGFDLQVLNQEDTAGYFKGDIQVDVKGWRNLFFDEQKQIKNIVLKDAKIYYALDHPLMMKSQEGREMQEIEVARTRATGKLILAETHGEQSGLLTTEFDLSAALPYSSKKAFALTDFIDRITHFRLSAVHYNLPDGFYQLSMEEVAFGHFHEIVLKQVIINPVDTREVFAERKKVATDFISVTIDSIHLVAFDSQVSNRIFIDQIHIYQPSIDVYKDKNYPKNEAYKAILVDLLLELETPVHIKMVTLSNMFIKYTQLPENAEETGYLFFDEANATIVNITNVNDSILVSGKMQIEAEAKFYGVGHLQTTMIYELLPGLGQFNVKGNLSPMEIGKANAILSKLIPVKIKTGQLDTLFFSFSGTRTHADGEMWFEYSDLTMDLLEANGFNGIGNSLLRNSNPADNGTFRVGAITQDRDITKSMIQYWWVCLQSGFISTLGMAPEKSLINYKTGQDATLRDKMGMGAK